MIEDVGERAAWLSSHYWDNFTQTDSLYFSDSLRLNGVKKETVEEQMGIFATLLGRITREEGSLAMESLFSRLEAFQMAFPQSEMLPYMSSLAEHYFYDPNSPVRSEELFLPFVSGLASSELVDPAQREAASKKAGLCALNRPGTKAADFTFIDTKGARCTLYGIKAEKTLLIFGNPDCTACKDLLAGMKENDYLSRLISSGTLKVADIYIDEDIAQWKEKSALYPAEWINGYDPTGRIRADLLYSVRAIPSMYLLDKDKTVLLKDAAPDQVLRAL